MAGFHGQGGYGEAGVCRGLGWDTPLYLLASRHRAKAQQPRVAIVSACGLPFAYVPSSLPVL